MKRNRYAFANPDLRIHSRRLVSLEHQLRAVRRETWSFARWRCERALKRELAYTRQAAKRAAHLFAVAAKRQSQQSTSQ